VIFGDELKVKPGEAFTLSFDLQSVAGVKQVELIGAGAVARTESFHAPSQQVRVDFPLSTQSRTWYSLIVEDNQGHKAYTDPIWWTRSSREPPAPALLRGGYRHENR